MGKSHPTRILFISDGFLVFIFNSEIKNESD